MDGDLDIEGNEKLYPTVEIFKLQAAMDWALVTTPLQVLFNFIYSFSSHYSLSLYFAETVGRAP